MKVNEILEFYVECVEKYNKPWDIFEDANHVIVFFGNTELIKNKKQRIYNTIIEFVIQLMSICESDFNYIITELNKKITNVDEKKYKRLQIENRCDKLTSFMLKKSAWRNNYAERLKTNSNLTRCQIEPIF